MDSLPTRTTRPTTALVVPGFLSKQYGGNAAPEHMGIGLSEATGTVTTWDHHAFVGMPFLMYAGSNPYEPRGVDEVAPTMTCSERSALVTPSAFLSYYYGNLQASGLHEAAGTVTTVDRAALVQALESVEVEDCTFRMLKPHEIGAAMAFPSDYVVLGNQRDQVRQYGNAVTPPAMGVLIERCLDTLRGERVA